MITSLRKNRTLLITLMVFVLLWAVMFIFLGRFGINVFGQSVKPDFITAIPKPAFLNFSVMWDSYWYHSIVTQGYPKEITPVYAFYPFYPLIVKTVSSIGVNPILAGFVVNVVASFFACLGLYKISEEFVGKKNAYFSVLLFLAFPMSFYLFTFYTEALFCALSFWAIYFARQKNWPAAAVLASLCGATKLVGLLVFVPIALEYFRSIDYKPRKINLQVLWLALIPVGFLAYVAFSYWHTGNMLAMFDAYKTGHWAYQSFQPNFVLTLYNNSVQVIRTGEFRTLIPLVCWFGALVVILLARKKLPLSFIAYVLVSLVVFVLNNNVVSVNRYVVPLFPVYIGTVMLLSKREYLLGLLIGAMAFAQGVFFVMFINGYWIA